MKTVHTDSAYTGFLAAHDDKISLCIKDNPRDVLKSEASTRRSNIEEVKVVFSKFYDVYILAS
jgi:GPI-anchor transamidase subunit K